MDAQQITTLESLIETLGGTVATARKFGATHPSVVSMWLKRGNIASNLADKHRAILKAEGISASSAIWGMAELEKTP